MDRIERRDKWRVKRSPLSRLQDECSTDTWDKLRPRAFSIFFQAAPAFWSRFVHLESYYRGRAFLEIPQASSRKNV